MTLKTFLSLIAAFACSVQGIAFAQTINVTNGDFELPAGGSQQAQSIPNFTFVNADGYQGTINDTTFGNNLTGLSLGNEVGFFNITQPSLSTVTSGTLTTIVGGTNYQATIAVGNLAGTGIFNDPGNVTLNLLADGNIVASTAIPSGTIPEDTIENFSVTLNGATSLALTGQALTFQLAALDPLATGFNPSNPNTDLRPVFDNLTLVASVPEPATYAMLMIGGLGLFLAVRRRRALLV